jgi:hypothetical protein
MVPSQGLVKEMGRGGGADVAPDVNGVTQASNIHCHYWTLDRTRDSSTAVRLQWAIG